MRLISTGIVSYFMGVVLLTACGRSAPTGPGPTPVASPAPAPAPVEVQSNLLRVIIEDEIRQRVKLSYGEWNGENFSDVDLAEFRRQDVPGQVTTHLRTNTRFLQAVEQVRAMAPEPRAAYLQKCREPVHKTWRELGRIPADGSGQSSAGQQAEIAVASAAVDLVERLLDSPAVTGH